MRIQFFAMCVLMLVSDLALATAQSPERVRVRNPDHALLIKLPDDHFDARILLDPMNADLYLRRAMLRRAKQQFAGAISDYGEAIRLKPTCRLTLRSLNGRLLPPPTLLISGSLTAC